jgi:hypothetical protein
MWRRVALNLVPELKKARRHHKQASGKAHRELQQR